MRSSVGFAGRIFLYTAAVVGAVLAAVVIVASHDGRRVADEVERRGLEQAADVTAQLLAGRGRSLAGGARVFVQGPYFRALVAGGRRDDVVDQAFEAADQLGASWVFITDDQGALLAKSDEPGVRGTPMGNVPLVSRALEGRTTAGYGVSRDSQLFQVVAVPIVVPGAAPVGALVATKILDRQTAQDIRAAIGADVVFYALDARHVPRLAATSFDDTRGAIAVLPLPGALPRAHDRAASTPVRRARIAEQTYALQGAALTTAGGDVTGGFVVARPVGTLPPGITAERRSLVLGGLLGLFLAVVVASSATRRVTRPARALGAAAQQALDGRYEIAAQAAADAVTSGSSGEISSLGGALAALLCELREKQALVAVLATTGTTASAQRSDDPPLPLPRRGGHDKSLGTRTASAGRSARIGVVASAPHLRLPPRGASALAPGVLVADRYALQEVLGSGGSGVVFKAHDQTLGETVAFKALRSDLLEDDQELRDQLQHAIRLTRRVLHRNVVRAYDVGSERGVSFLTMEYVAGTGLAGLLAHRGALPRDAVLAIARQLLRALEAAHEQGVIHGDLKPANILVSADGLLKVSDVGVAAVMRRPRGISDASESAQPPTLAGALVGTPEYMAPELLLGSAPDARSDMYAAGVVLHECLTGDTPFARDEPPALLATKLESPIVAAASRSFLPARKRDRVTLEGVIAWMTSATPASRPASAADVSALLAQL